MIYNSDNWILVIGIGKAMAKIVSLKH